MKKTVSKSQYVYNKGVILFALRTEPKLLAVSRPLLAICQSGLFLWPTVISLILFFYLVWNCELNNPTALEFL